MTSCNHLSEEQAADMVGIEPKILKYLRLQHPDMFFFNIDEDGYVWYCSSSLDAEELRDLEEALVGNGWLDHVEAVLHRAAA